MKKLITYITLTLLCFNSIKAQQVPDLETYTLKNGLKIYFLKYGKIEAMNLSVIINTGKKNEIPGQQGYNNITANLVLQGNKKFTQEMQNDKAFAIGAQLNAASDFDKTTISTDFLSKDANTVFDLVSSAVINPLFVKENVERTISYFSDYNNPAKMDISNLTKIYSNLSIYGLENPLGRNMYKAQLKSITSEKIKDFHLFNYTPKNTKILICGNFNTSEIKALIETYFAGWQSTYGEINGVSLDLPTIKKQEIYFVNRTAASQCALQWNKTAPALKEKDALAFNIANKMFNQILFKEIREKGGKTYGIGSYHTSYKFSNLFMVNCSVRSNELINTITLFDKTLQDFAAGNFNTESFTNEVTSLKTELILMEYPEQISDFYSPITYDYNSRKNILKDLTNLKPEEVQKVIKKYFTPESYKLVIAGDETLVSSQLEKIKGLKKYKSTDLELKN